MRIERFTAARLPDWDLRLDDFLRDSMTADWAWGQHDCIMWACAAVAAMTGADPAAGFRGTYDSEAGAEDMLASLGHKSILGPLQKLFGRPLRGVGFAQRGDVVLAMIEGTAFAGICLGAVSVFAQQPLVRVPTAAARMAWRV